MFRNAVALGLLALLCGCATTPNLPPAGTAFDGVYVGRTTLLRGGGQPCGIADMPRELRVSDGKFDYPFQVEPPTVRPLRVQVAADGSFNFKSKYYITDELSPQHFTMPWMTISGRIADGTLVATEDDLRCARRSVLHRR